MNWLGQPNTPQTAVKPSPVTLAQREVQLRHIDTQLRVLSRSLQDWIAGQHDVGNPVEMRHTIDALLDERINVMNRTP